MYDVVIVGAGPAGITAAIYCARSNLRVALLDKNLIGGNLYNYLEIQNYPGLPGSTENVIDNLCTHLNMYPNIEQFEFQNIEYIDLKDKIVKTEEQEFQGKKIIIATGSRPKKLGVPGEEEHIGHGVHYCAICDGPLYKDKIVAVIGGGNSACEEALGLSKICKKVYIIEFTDKLNAEQSTVDKIYNTENIEVHTGYAVTKIEDEQVDNENYLVLVAVPRETLEKKKEPVEYATRPSLKLWVNGIFPYIGMSPNLPKFTGFPFGGETYICVNKNMETTAPDIYAIGDIRIKDYRQVITAMADGAIAAIHISKVL